jgi:hypothetical protein
LHLHLHCPRGFSEWDCAISARACRAETKATGCEGPVKIRSTKTLRPHENNGLGTYHVKTPGHTVFRAVKWSYIGVPWLRSSHYDSFEVMRTAKGTSRSKLPRIGVGAIYGPLCSSVGCSECSQQMVAPLVVVEEFGVRSNHHHCCVASLACIHVPCTTLVHRANYEVVPTGTASA